MYFKYNESIIKYVTSNLFVCMNSTESNGKHRKVPELSKSLTEDGVTKGSKRSTLQVHLVSDHSHITRLNFTFTNTPHLPIRPSSLSTAVIAAL